MSLKKYIVLLISLLSGLMLPLSTAATEISPDSLRNTIAEQLGWSVDNQTQCGGYYLDQPFRYPAKPENKETVDILGDQGMISQQGTSILQGKVSVTRFGEQLTANRANVYRDPTTHKLAAIEVIGNVHFREPNTLILSSKGYYNLQTKMKTLEDIVFRTAFRQGQIPRLPLSAEEIATEHRVTSLTAWGQAKTFMQKEPRIYDFTQTSFSTCPPVGTPAWQVKASHVVLDKNTGRGYATHARILVKNVPVFYTPYINFPIDNRRKSGFLWPTVGNKPNLWGTYFLAPYYFNLAPNYDMIFTPGYLSERGALLEDKFRYLTPYNSGFIDVNIIPDDRFFANFKRKIAADQQFSQSTDPATQAEFNRLMQDSTTRKSLVLRDDGRFNDNWSSHVELYMVSDDYYLRDFGNNLPEVTQNQLLQEGDLYYKSRHWNFIGRVQGYQTLHPIDDETITFNAYRRLPQLILNADYPNLYRGFDFGLNTEATYFTIRNTPGVQNFNPLTNTAFEPMATRYNLQPIISFPISRPAFYITPRIQLITTKYNLVGSQLITRNVPVYDVLAGMMFDRDMSWFGHAFRQTLEPQFYYDYIPFREQNNIPIFDTTVNTLLYDQIFNYNRFTGLDRIGDTNQLSIGLTSRFIDQENGVEKIRLGAGEIIYFQNRRVTLCGSSLLCNDYPDSPSNTQKFSPLTAFLNYTVSQNWNTNLNTIWNPNTSHIDNSTITFHYQPETQRIINLGYSFARNGDFFSGISGANSSTNNLQLTDMSIVWPIYGEISGMGRWSEDWNTRHFQNLLYGVQYDTCCWAIRFVGGRAFTHLAENGTPEYNNQYYIQFALKGLGGMGTGSSSILNNITGYNNQFGQDL